MRRFCFLLVAVAAFVAMWAGPATAQVPPLPPLPQLPELPPVPAPPPETAPVFEIVAPTASPTCGTALLALFVARTTAPAYSTQIIQASAPLVVICGAVPAPPAPLRCSLDVQAQAVFDQVQGAALGAPTGVLVRPEGQVVEEIVLVENKLPPPANTAGLGDLVVSTLLCEPLGVPAGTPGDATTPPPDFGAPPFAPTYPTTPFGAPPLAYAPSTQPPTGTTALPATRAVGRPVLYGVIWVLPLALLAFACYFGGALTREIEIASPPE